MKIRILMAVLAVGCAAAISPSAKAETFGPWTPKTAPVGQNDSVYITLGAGGFLQNTPSVSFFSALDGSGLFSAAPDIVGGTGGVTLGILLDNRRISWPGKKPRIEFSFAYGRGSGSTEQSQFIPSVGGTTLFFTSVDGRVVAGFVCAVPGCTSNTRLTVGYQSVSGAVRLKTDIPVARNLYITPALGFVGGRSTVDYKINNLINSGGAAVGFPHTLNESLKTTRLGGEAAADVTWKVNGSWTLHGGASFALFRLGTRLKANDCITGVALPAGSSCSGTLAQTSVTAFDRQTGYRVGMNAGVTYDGGWYKLTLVGQGMWDSDVPGVQNPTTANLVGLTTAPARIEYSSQWRYGGFVSVAFPF